MASTKREPGDAPAAYRQADRPNPLGRERTDPKAQAIIDESHARAGAAPNPRAKFGGGSGENEVDDDGQPTDAVLRARAGMGHPSTRGLHAEPPRPNGR